MTVNNLDTGARLPPLTEEQWEALGNDLLAGWRAERAQAEEEEAGRLARFHADRAAIPALSDAALMEEMQAQGIRWDAALEDVLD